MFAVIHFGGFVDSVDGEPKPAPPPVVDVRVFATLPEAHAYRAGHTDAHDFDDVAYSVRIYNEKGEVVD